MAHKQKRINKEKDDDQKHTEDDKHGKGEQDGIEEEAHEPERGVHRPRGPVSLGDDSHVSS